MLLRELNESIILESTDDRKKLSKLLSQVRVAIKRPKIEGETGPNESRYWDMSRIFTSPPDPTDPTYSARAVVYFKNWSHIRNTADDYAAAAELLLGALKKIARNGKYVVQLDCLNPGHKKLVIDDSTTVKDVLSLSPTKTLDFHQFFVRVTQVRSEEKAK